MRVVLQISAFDWEFLVIKVAAALSDLAFSAIRTTRTILGLYQERREMNAHAVVIVRIQFSKLKVDALEFLLTTRRSCLEPVCWCRLDSFGSAPKIIGNFRRSSKERSPCKTTSTEVVIAPECLSCVC